MTWDDYCEISQRSNIQVGIMSKSSNNKCRQHYYSFKVGKGRIGLENYYNVKRNKITRVLDEYAFENCEEDLDEDSNKRELEDKREDIYVKENVRWCAQCKNGTVEKKINLKDGQQEIKLHVCPKCNKRYTDLDEYYNIKENDKEKYNFILLRNVVSKVFVTNQNRTFCEKCENELIIIDVKLKVYEDVRKNNTVENRSKENLFYCKCCKRYYATPPYKKDLENKYGKNKINFKE